MRNFFAALTIGLITIVFLTPAHATDWKKVSADLLADYKGKITAIKKLDSSTCWAVLSPKISYQEAVKLAESIGYYIRNSTGGMQGEKPSVHVFIGNKHIAVARPSGLQFIGELDVKVWK